MRCETGRGLLIFLSMRLLCADDEPDIRTILEMALSLEPRLEVEIFSSGVDLLARAKQGNVDAILLDAMMPDVDGYETCRRLKADPATAHVPVVFLTARAQRGEQDIALQVGALACLTKPFDPLTLAGELMVALGQ